VNPIRNHLDIMKGGRFSAHLQPARAVHLVVTHAESYEALMQRNVWLHNLPECSTFADAVRLLKKWEAWEAVPAAVRAHLERADPRFETIKPEAFAGMRYSVYAVMPLAEGMVAAAQRRAEELGFRAYLVVEDLRVEAGQAGLMMAQLARTVEARGAPFAPPCALFTSGEVVVTAGRAPGIGGRNQEYALAAAQGIAGSDRIVVGAVDSDGTDGPGAQFFGGEEEIPTLAGGVVDGQTLAEAAAAGIDAGAELRRHNSTPVLCKLGSGIVATHSVSLNDLQVAVVMGGR
jgi:glycerate-2-kinase